MLSYDNIEDYDKIFVSKVFTDTKVPDEILNDAKVEYGGTGFYYDKAKPLPYEIEHCKPDYSLYNEFVRLRLEKGDKPKTLEYYTNYSIGFATRGCIRRCSFCVNKNYTKCLRSSPISEFVDKNRRYICLLDDNVLACEDWKKVFEELKETGKRFQFKQGIDERLLTDEKCKTIFGSRWIGDFIFAFDNIKDKKIIEHKLKMIRKYTRRRIKFYCFCGYNHDSPDNIESYTNNFWANDIKDLFERIKEKIKFIETDFEKSIKYNPSMTCSPKIPKNREKFFSDLDNYELNILIKKYLPKQKLKNKIYNFLRRIKRNVIGK